MEPQHPSKSYKWTKTTVSSRERSERSHTYDDMEPLSRSTARRGTLKYGTGKYANVELVPQPSNLPEDPLNWSSLKKNAHFASLLMTVGTIGTLKTILVTVNAVVATELNVSYGASVALTGVPLIMGAGFGIKSRVLAQSVGKRGIQICSALVMLLAAVWNMHVIGSYTEFMISRVFQGIGWGMFEALMDDAIADMFFEHERPVRQTIHQLVSIFFTWGSPILGGYLSQQSQSFRNEIMILNIIQSFGIVFLILFSPETTFNRSSLHGTATLQDDALATSMPAAKKSAFKAYLHSLKPTGPHSTRKFQRHPAIRTLKALCTPSALLNTLLCAPLAGTAYGLANSLSLLFSAMPTFLFPMRIGYIFVLPAVFALFTFSCTILLSKRGGSGALGSAALGMATGIAGLLAFGLYTANSLSRIESSGVFSLNTQEAISLVTVSALFGLLVAGAVALSTASSSYFTSYQTSPEITAASKALQEVIIGIWTIGLPIWAQGMAMGMDMDVQEAMWMGLKETVVALAVVTAVLSSTVGAALWAKGADLRRGDVKILGGGREDEGLEMGRVGSGKGGKEFFES